MPNGTRIYSTNYVKTPISWHYENLEAVREPQPETEIEAQRRRPPGQGFRSDLVLKGRQDLVKNAEERRVAGEADLIIIQMQTRRQKLHAALAAPSPLQLQAQTVSPCPTPSAGRHFTRALEPSPSPSRRRSNAPSPEASVITPPPSETESASLPASAPPSESRTDATATFGDEGAWNCMQQSHPTRNINTITPAHPLKVNEETESTSRAQQNQLQHVKEGSYFNSTGYTSGSHPLSISLNSPSPSSETEHPLPVEPQIRLVDSRKLPLPIPSRARYTEASSSARSFMSGYLIDPTSRYRYQLERSLVLQSDTSAQGQVQAQAHDLRHRFSFPPTASAAAADIPTHCGGSLSHAHLHYSEPQSCMAHEIIDLHSRDDENDTEHRSADHLQFYSGLSPTGRSPQAATNLNKRGLGDDDNGHAPLTAPQRVLRPYLTIAPPRDCGASSSVAQPSWPITQGTLNVSLEKYAALACPNPCPQPPQTHPRPPHTLPQPPYTHPYPHSNFYPYRDYPQSTCAWGYPTLAMAPKSSMLSSISNCQERGRSLERRPRYSRELGSIRATSTERYPHQQQRQRRRTASPRPTPRPPPARSDSEEGPSYPAYVNRGRKF